MSTESKLQPAAPEVEIGLIKAHHHAAFGALLFSVLFGVLVSVKMNHPGFIDQASALTWGRLRYNHTQGIFFGWLGNAFLMFLYYAIPRLANRPVFSRKIGWLLFFLWNFAVLIPGWALVFSGYSQPLEWAEFPLPVDFFVVLSLALTVVQFVIPLFRPGLSSLYVSAWYVLGGLVFTLLAYPVGNIAPQLLPGAIGAAFSGLWIHDAIGLYVTPLALSIAYFVIPAVTGKPIYSHFLSMIGFWLLFLVYPLNGTHHYVFSAIPMEAQHVAIAASALLGLDVILVVANLLASLRGQAEKVKQDISLRFVRTGTILYLIVSLQGSLQAFMPVNKLVHFSDWVIGHSHLAMLGFATFTTLGGVSYVWKNLPGSRYNSKGVLHAYWLLLSGLVAMVAALTAAGLIEAQVWSSDLPWLDSVRSVKWLWLVRSAAAVPIAGGFLLLWLSMRGQEEAATASSVSSTPPAAEKIVSSPIDHGNRGAVLSRAYSIVFIAGVGFFALSFAGLAIMPGVAMEKEIAATRPPTMLDLTATEARGREVYAVEGCAYCHTQQVRKVENDVQRFGATTRVWETVYDYPQLWGTRRVGPDLARESKVRPDDWQYAHLYSPRSLVPDSVMPAYPWLFDGEAGKPRDDARALVAYVRSLGRERERAGFGPAAVPDYCLCPQEVKDLEKLVVPVTASASMARIVPSGDACDHVSVDSKSGIAESAGKGADIYKHNCAGCHGVSGKGDGPGSPSLLPSPADLTVRRISAGRMEQIMTNGVYGSSMPAWRDLQPAERGALIAFLPTLGASDESATGANGTFRNTQEQSSALRLFAQHCASCHGARGDGKGPAAATMAPAPTDFVREQPAYSYAVKVLQDGVPGTSMPPWKEQLDNGQRHLLAVYVRSLYKEATK
jgi:cytochrome c oxidase cbb3-type subunit I/II